MLRIFASVAALILVAACQMPGASFPTAGTGENGSRAASSALGGKIVMGYMPDWAGDINAVQYSKLTHIGYAFLQANADGSLNLSGVTVSRLQQLTALAHAAGTKVLISLGGWSNADAMTAAMRNAGARAAFANNVLNFVSQYGLDGADFDWEGPANAADGTYYQAFVQTLYNSLHPQGKLVTTAVGQWFGDNIPPASFASLDFVGLMAYDNGGLQHSDYNFAVSNMNYWIGRGVPAAKAVLGVPFYGYDTNRTGQYAYNVITANDANAHNSDFSTYLGGVYYNGIPTITQKTQYAKNYGGVMMWELSQDAAGSKSLVSAIFSTLSVASQTPYGGSNRSLSDGAVLQAEDYDLGGEGVAYHDTSAGNTGAVYRADGVDLETSTDTGGGSDVGWTVDGEWLEYTVNATAGTYNVTARVASAGTTVGDLRLLLDGAVLGTFPVNATGGWQTWTDVTLNNLVVPGGSGKVLRLELVGGDLNVNYLKFTAVAPPPSTGTPYGGTNRAVNNGAVLQAEDYNVGGEGVAYHDNSAGNTGTAYRADAVDIEATTDSSGGAYNVGWIVDGEWLNYAVNTTAGTYTITARVASAGAAVGDLQVLLDGVVLGTIAVDATGGWQTFVDKSISGIVIPGGNGKVLQLKAVNGGDFNVNSIRFSTASAAPDFGPNVLIFDPSMSASAIQTQLNNVYSIQQNNQFGNERYALVFKPGTYNVDINVGFYTQVLGLGQSPNQVSITNNLHSDAFLSADNATCNFWRGVENFSVTPVSGTVKWAVAQATPFRRMHVVGSMVLSQNNGWSSGGFIADTKVDNTVNNGTQQQWITRNSQIGSWSGQNWNEVFVGVSGAPSGASWPNPPYTVINQAPVEREKPFLYLDAAGNYNVLVPSLTTNSSGITWASGSTPGTSLPLSQFYIAKAGTDTSATMNAALSSGKHLLLTPGIYHLNDTLRVNNANTVVLGLGFATLIPDNGVNAMAVADVDGVKIAGILFDAGTVNSPILLEVGPTGSSAGHSGNPTSLSDVFFRIGGATVGKASVSLKINSNDVIGDHFWVWRADHSDAAHPGTVGWTVNTAANGLIVNGANVTIYGLFVEHYQQYQTLWNGNGGRVYFYQSEIPYDVPNQASWMSAGGNGYASYKVADSVTSHQAWGVGVYCYFNVNPAVKLANAIEVPQSGLNGAMFHNMTTVSLGGTGEITHVIDGWGGTANAATQTVRLIQ